VESFAKHFHRAPDQLGPEPIRAYQVCLFTERKSRAVARASSMLATLSQAISRSSPTAAASVYSVLRNCPTTLSTETD
jgi:hypothetical protein